MAAKNFIVRHKEGRKTFYTLSDRGRAILREGQEKMFAGWQPQDWDGRWTFVRIQVPESKRTLRHQMASRLSWAGFAQVDGGPWVAPGPHDVATILGPEQSVISPIVVYGEPQPPTSEEMLAGAFDLAELAADYESFGEKWRAVDPDSLSPVDALVKRVELHLIGWLLRVRTRSCQRRCCRRDGRGPRRVFRFESLMLSWALGKFMQCRVFRGRSE